MVTLNNAYDMPSDLVQHFYVFALPIFMEIIALLIGFNGNDFFLSLLLNLITTRAQQKVFAINQTMNNNSIVP